MVDAATYTVKAAKNAGEKANPHGGTLVKWYLTLTDEQGNETSDVYCQKKPENPLNPGDTIYGRLEEGEYGWRLYPEANPNGYQRRSGGPSAPQDGPDAEFWAQKDKRIARAGIVQAIVSSHPAPSNRDSREEYASDITAWLDEVDRLADALLVRLDAKTPHPNEVSGSGAQPNGTATSEAAKPPAAPSGFASESQRDKFATPALQRAGADVSIAIPYLAQLPRDQVRVRLDALGEEATREKAAQKIQAEAEEWAKAGVPDGPPPDDRDLPPVGGGSFIADDSEIPFAPEL